MFEISFSNVMYSKKDKHSIGVWLVDWLDYCKFIVCADVKTYPRLKKDSNSKTYRIIYTHQEALRNECRIREEWNRKSTLTEQRNRQSDCGFDLDQSTVEWIFMLCTFMIWWPSRLASRVFSDFLSSRMNN